MKQDAYTWLKKASNPKDERDHCHTPHARNGSTYAADGFRMHIIRTTATIPTESESKIDYEVLVPSKRENTATISKAHLVQAVTACKPFARKSENITRFSMNGSLEVSASTSNFSNIGDGVAEYADCQVTLTDGDQWPVKGKRKASMVQYRHTGDDVCFALDYKYLLDALSGMSEVVTLSVKGPDYPVLISGEVDGVLRMAVIMPMHVGE